MLFFKDDETVMILVSASNLQHLTNLQSINLLVVCFVKDLLGMKIEQKSEKILKSIALNGEI